MKLTTLQSAGEPKPTRPGAEGIGECLEYAGKYYHYRPGKFIPKDRVVSLRWEGNWCSRQKGDVEHIIVAFNGSGWTVLEHAYDGLKAAMKRYAGIEPAKAIAAAQKRLDDIEAHHNSGPKCKCGRAAIVIFDGQPRDVCTECWRA